jgi:peptidoglycan-N-acetylglucosamine deacetylase
MRHGHRPVPHIALTFDDGPDPVWTPLVLEALSEARATFFVVAPRARRFPSLLADMRDAGHEVAFHCTEHLRHDTMLRGEIDADLRSGLHALARPARFWRTPWGVVTPATEAVAGEHGLTLVGWTADTEDWRGDAPAEMLARVKGDLVSGAIVLLHDGVGPGARRDGCAETVALVQPLVSLARSRGLEPGLLDDLHPPLPDRNPDYPVSKVRQ